METSRRIEVSADTIMTVGLATLKRDHITGATYWEVSFKVRPPIAARFFVKICKVEVDDVAFKLGIKEPYHWDISISQLGGEHAKVFVRISIP